MAPLAPPKLRLCKRLVAFIRNAFPNTCLVFHKTKMDFLVTEMKGLT